MYRIDVATAAGSAPTPSVLGTEGYWTAGSPSSGTPATVMDQDWFNALQENLIAILTAAETAHSKSDYQTLLRGLRSLFGQYAADTGTANAYAISLTPALIAHVAGMPIRWKATNSNTGASTFNDGAGAVSLVNSDGSALINGQIVAGRIYVSAFDGTNHQLISPPSIVDAPVGHQEIFTSSGTFTAPANTQPGTTFKFTLIGGGGGGGGADGTNCAGGGGGAGGLGVYYAFGLSPNESVTVTIGAAGTSGSSAGGGGGAGGSTSITIGSTTVTSNGGHGGTGATGTASAGAGEGGSVGTASLNSSGGWGFAGLGGSMAVGGNGGASFMGGGGAGAIGSAGGQAAAALGSGGGGAASNNSVGQIGGVGAQGFVLVEWVL